MKSIEEATNKYREFVTQNRSLVGALESAIQGLSFLVPSTLPDHELFIEGLHSLSGLFATFNHAITLPKTETSIHRCRISHDHYQLLNIHILTYIDGYNSDAFIQSLISLAVDVEVFAEKLGARLGGKDATILAIEAFKAFLRLRLLLTHKDSMLFNGEKLGSQSRLSSCIRPELKDYQGFCAPKQLPTRHHYGLHTAIPSHMSSSSRVVHTGTRTGLRLRVPASYLDAANNGKGSDAASTQSGVSPTTTSTSISIKDETLAKALFYLRMGEVLHILRPVIYAAAKYLMMRGKQATKNNRDAGNDVNVTSVMNNNNSSDSSLWMPWIISLFVELYALFCTAKALSMLRGLIRKDDVAHVQSHPFEQELIRRKYLLWWYLLRSPVFESGVKPLLDIGAGTLGRVPLIGGVWRYLAQLAEYLHRHHFYTAASS